MSGNPEYACELEEANFAKVAEAMAIKMFRIEDCTTRCSILNKALAC